MNEEGRWVMSGTSAGAPAGAASYLDHIMPAVLRRLEERKRRAPAARIAVTSGPGARPSFGAAIRTPGVSLIAEVKRASPSKGLIRPDLDAAALAQSYERAGARAVSVLTEQDYFKGSLDDLRAVVAATGLPVLRKDFIVDEYQVREAKACGASAILLIAALLSDEELSRLATQAAGLGLDVLLEVHDSAEMERAGQVEGAIIGVNNRDLHTFAVSLDTTVRLAGLAPGGRLLVGESGIRTRADVERLAAAGVDAVLVGESLLRNADVEAAIHELMGILPATPADSFVHMRMEETS